jgi:N-acetylmuramoyl-L-alanine amidase
MCLLAVLLPTLLFAQDNILRVQYQEDPSRSTTIGIFRRGTITYASLADIAAAFSLGTYENSTAKKFELKQQPFRLTGSAGNPFLVATDSTNRRSIYQVPHGVIHAAGTYFAPLASFLPFFERVFGKSVAYDEQSRILRILSTVVATGFDIATLQLEPKSNGMVVRIPATRRLTDFESLLRQDGWIYVTIADARADVNAINALKPAGLIRKIIAIQSPTSVQLTFHVPGKIAATEMTRVENSNDILLSIRTPGNEEKILLEKKKREIQAGLESQRKRWELDVIVIDPGHGGKDYGALGVTRVKEKDITLGVGLKLGALIEKSLKNVKVVYTRKDDSFVELHRRGQIANEADGKLFISIHCNSLRRKPSPTRGFEVYLLRPGRTEEAIEIAERENAVIQLEEGYEERYKELTDENFILVTMARSAHVRASEVFADIAQQEMEDHLTIPNRGVRQAGFLVLVGAAMPNVLVETAYLSNRDDERFLKSESSQEKIAKALFEAIKRYKEEYEKLLLEGKELGER